MKVFTAQQMRDFDKEATEKYGIPSIVLMENAALRVVELLEAKFAPLADKKIVILCGKGNNGGDGLAIARHLESFSPHIYIVGELTQLKGDALANLKICMGIGQPIEELHQPSPAALTGLQQRVADADIIIDALLGTGFSGDIRAGEREIFDIVNRSAGTVVAVDVPSGLEANTGKADSHCLSATYTVTFQYPKRGAFLRSGVEKFGDTWVGSIGTGGYQTYEDEPVGENYCKTLDLEFAQSHIPTRSRDAHKGDAGRALIIGGSYGMSGAVALACKAALNVGAGLCIAAVPDKILPSFAASILEATSHPLACDESGKLLERAADELSDLWKGVQAVALGPGISRSEETQKFVHRVVRECPAPLIIDADALHALPAISDAVKNRGSETVLTPHPGEMGALMGISAKEVNESRFEVALECAQKYEAVIVLKGAYSLVATPNGEVFVNLSGNPGMATGGSGDVLTGTIAGLLAQIKEAEDATKLGVYLHGFAGDLAFQKKGNGLVAGDIAAHLGAALVEIPRRQVEKINSRLRRLM